MTISEAEKIFNIWRQWYWPTHFALESVFISYLPESLLPYPKAILEEALNITAKLYYDSGDYETSKKIQSGITSLISYVNDEEALLQASKTLSNPEMREAVHIWISKYKKDWESWLIKKEGQQESHK